MEFIQNQIDRGYTNIHITFRGRKEFINGVPKITQGFSGSLYRGIDTVEKYDYLMKMVSSHPNGVSVGWAKP